MKSINLNYISRLIFLWSVVILVIVFPNTIKGQSHKDILQSMKRSIPKVPTDSLPEHLIEIAWKHRINVPDIDSFLSYVEKAELSAEQYQRQDIQAKALRFKGVYEGRSGNFEKSQELLSNALSLYEAIQDTMGMADVFYSQGIEVQRRGDDIQFVERMLKAISYYDSLHEWNKKGMALITLGIQYARLDNLEMALEKLTKAHELIEFLDTRNQLYLLLNQGKNYRRLFQKTGTDSLLSLSIRQLEEGLALSEERQERVFTGEIKLALLDTYQVLDPPSFRHDYADDVLNIGKETDDNFLRYQGHLAHAQMYISEGLPSDALRHRKPMRHFVDKLSNPIYFRSFYEINYHISKDLGRDSEALGFLENYKLLNDSLLSVDRVNQYNDILEKYEREKNHREIEKLSNEKSNLLAERELQQYQLHQRGILLAAIVLTSLLALAILYLWSNQSREKEKNKTLLIEQQLLRSQMNPHFIFNALNGIKRFYVEGKIDIANDFLADFSNLLRKILDRSNETHIHVSEEIDFLRLYLELEERRLNGALNFDLNFNEEDFNYDDKVPALILQPIVENAIWHGISGKRRGGEIKINCKKVDDQMVCEIEDNGAGFSTSEKLKSENHQSRGLNLVRRRLGNRGSLMIEELRNTLGEISGTKVMLIFKTT